MVTAEPETRRAHIGARLSSLLAPRSIAVIGASDRPEVPGTRVIGYLRRHGYEGELFAVARRRGQIQGLDVYPNLDDLPSPPQLVIIAVAIENAPEMIRAAGRRGADAAVIFGAGADAALSEQIRAASHESGVIVLGPNCTGFINVSGHVAAGFNSAFELCPLAAGDLSLVTQSGGVGSALVNRLHDAGIGMNYMVSTGDELDIGIGDLLSFLANEPASESVLAYVESFRSADSFLAGAEALRAAGKRLVVLKSGNSPVAQSAAQTHTNAIATDGDVAEAVLTEVGATFVTTIREAVDVVSIDKALREVDYRGSTAPAIALIGTSGGGCVLAADAAARAGLSVATFSSATAEALTEILPSFATVGNPLDVTAGLLSDPTGLTEVVKTVGRDRNVGLIVTIGLISTRVLAEKLASGIAQIRAEGGPPIVAATETGSLVEQIYGELRVPGATVIHGLDDCMRAIAKVASTSQGTSHAGFDQPEPATIEVLPAGTHDLSEEESLAVFASAGLPVVLARPIQRAEDLDDPGLTYPLALKVSAASVFHKQRHQLLALDLATAEAARAARTRLIEAAAQAGATDGAIVAQSMAPRGVELILGLRQDPVFGSIVALGIGGILVEALSRVALARASAAYSDPESLIRRAGVGAGLPEATHGALVETVRAFARFVVAGSRRLRECEINPLIITPDGELAVVDAKICLDA